MSFVLCLMSCVLCLRFYLQSRMEERLDDAIWVLKSHAENPTMRGVPPMGYPAAAYPQGMTEALQVIELEIIITVNSFHTFHPELQK